MKIKWDDINMEKERYTALNAYGRSKLANVLFTVELAKRLKGNCEISSFFMILWLKNNIFEHLGTGVSTVSLHPGNV